MPSPDATGRHAAAAGIKASGKAMPAPAGPPSPIGHPLYAPPRFFRRIERFAVYAAGAWSSSYWVPRGQGGRSNGEPAARPTRRFMGQDDKMTRRGLAYARTWTFFGRCKAITVLPHEPTRWPRCRFAVR